MSGLAQLPLLDVAYDDSSWMTLADFFTAFDAKAEFNGAKLTMTSYQVSLDVAERGEGVALGWERSVGPRIEAGTLVERTYRSRGTKERPTDLMYGIRIRGWYELVSRARVAPDI